MNETVNVQLTKDEIWRYGYWGAIGVGGVLLLMGFGGKEYGYLIAACFAGIVARIVQAEAHFRASR